MTRYTVTYGYRTDSGLDYSMSTHHDSVDVDALDEATARHYAIDAAYEKHRAGCSHVTVESVAPAE